MKKFKVFFLPFFLQVAVSVCCLIPKLSNAAPTFEQLLSTGRYSGAFELSAKPIVITMTTSSFEDGRLDTLNNGYRYQGKVVKFISANDNQNLTNNMRDWLPALRVGKQVIYLKELKSYVQTIELNPTRAYGEIRKLNGETIESPVWRLHGSSFLLCKKIEKSSSLSESDCTSVHLIGDLIGDRSNLMAMAGSSERTRYLQSVKIDLDDYMAVFQFDSSPKALTQFDTRAKPLQ